LLLLEYSFFSPPVLLFILAAAAVATAAALWISQRFAKLNFCQQCWNLQLFDYLRSSSDSSLIKTTLQCTTHTCATHGSQRESRVKKERFLKLILMALWRLETYQTIAGI
jgi:hypothetical protein